MKILIAPNAFKGTIMAQDVAQSIMSGILRVCPDACIVNLPVSDGGDGSLDTFIKIFSGHCRVNTVTGPLGESVSAKWGVINEGRTAFIETALAFGLALVPEDRRNPSITTSRGVGDLIKCALDIGIRDFIIGVGGSANNDGGTGMLSSLGIKFLDENGVPLKLGGGNLHDLHEINVDCLDERIKDSKILVLSDSSVPLTGSTGVSLMYSPGKGASKEMALNLDNALTHYAGVVRKQFGWKIEDVPGSGAGGGVVSAAEFFLKADKAYGIDMVLQKLNIDEKLKGVDLVITGEGQIDEQTVYMKAPIGVAKAAKQVNKPVLAICAKTGNRFEMVYDEGVDGIVCVSGEDNWSKVDNIVNEANIEDAIADVFLQILKFNSFDFKQIYFHKSKSEQHKILTKFGYPDSLIKEFSHWYLLLRPEQVTIGSMVLIEKEFKSKYSDVSKESFVEFAKVVKQIESVIEDSFSYNKINYLMLMMLDEEVHYHIVPRYSRDIVFNDKVFCDHGWPGLPNFSDVNKSEVETLSKLLELLRGKFALC